ncbi:MAG: acyl-CoA dehydrogenase family protein [Phycisphaerae bacterium]
MANFYKDNDDIQFLFHHLDMARTAEIMEKGFQFSDEYDYAPDDLEDALDNYERILDSMGEICGDHIAPTAEETDTTGNLLHEDGTVTRAPGIAKAIEMLSKADLMGFTLPYRFGGINCPQCLFTMTNDIVSRADASLMNIYGLQGNADTLNAFASEEIKQEYLPRMASGEWTGAMVLTEPDAGSDLQAVKTRAYQDEDGNWFIHGVKRFITNGCGEVLLVLARTEPEISDGRGLSLLVCRNDETVKIRRLENKLGIHGSPTCEIFFNNTPAKLVGERQRGLITYVMSLMNGARVGIAAQSLGIGEAAYRVARDYAHSRKQFDTAIENFPAIREVLCKAHVDLQAARAITYYGAWCVDIEHGALMRLETEDLEKDEKTALRKQARSVGRWNKVLTPISKYYASEMSMRVSNDAIAVLGGSGYMKDYPVERHLRDSRITTIYEGTSQLQVVAAIAGVTSGTAKSVIEHLIEKPSRVDEWTEEVAPLIEKIKSGLEDLDETVAFVKSQGNSYRDLVARKLVDMATFLLAGALFCDHATVSDKKLAVAKYWLTWRMPELRMFKEQVLSGDTDPVDEFETIAGPVPVLE